MVYTGQGLRKKTQDEVKVMQQICGGQNHCVYKGLLQTEEQFQFKSQRHIGFPFSATFYVNGIMAGRISSCCEYRYTPGALQGKKSCFMLTRLAGGKPCYRCVNARHVDTPQPPKLPPKPPRPPTPKADVPESCPSSPLFVAMGTERAERVLRGLRAPSKGRNYTSSDSDGLTNNKRRLRPKAKRRKDPSFVRWEDSEGSEDSAVNMDENTPENQQLVRVNGSFVPENDPHIAERQQEDGLRNADGALQHERAMINTEDRKAQRMERDSPRKGRAGERDFFEEVMELSSSLENFSNKKIWFKVHKQERIAVQERMSKGPGEGASASEVELSGESESGDAADDHMDLGRKKTTVLGEGISIEELQKQLGAVADVLKASDEVDELVLRNTGMTDELLRSLVDSLKQSRSTVSTINLNLNLISPAGAHSLLELLYSKPQLKGLYLFGNRLGDSGVQMLLTGLADLQTSPNKGASPGEPTPQQHTTQPQLTQPQAAPGAMSLPPAPPPVPAPHPAPPSVPLSLVELDLGGNGIGRDGLQVLATYMRYHSQLRYLALGKTSAPDLTTWSVFFTSLKANARLVHVMLDECGLGDQGAKLVAETLRANVGIKKVDLDGNGIGDVGGAAILDALVSRKQSPMEHLSMEEGNHVSTAIMSKILQEIVKASSVPAADAAPPNEPPSEQQPASEPVEPQPSPPPPPPPPSPPPKDGKKKDKSKKEEKKEKSKKEEKKEKSKKEDKKRDEKRKDKKDEKKHEEKSKHKKKKK
ncbi:uncharacterized protein LOC134444166 [Engraulis encrasicolus]|uniref:uncharacterized protein LOC134444166 n=1 Tax=Engraulis encrasicolus TaxID=184585 RepID=UPI002FD024C6